VGSRFGEMVTTEFELSDGGRVERIPRQALLSFDVCDRFKALIRPLSLGNGDGDRMAKSAGAALSKRR